MASRLMLNPLPDKQHPNVPYSKSEQVLQTAHINIPLELQKPEILHIAAPENLNPGLYNPLPLPPLPEPEPLPMPTAPTETPAGEDTFVPVWQLESITVDFSDEFSNFDQANRVIELTVSGVLPSGDHLDVTTGVNTFKQPEINSVLNIPLIINWTREMGDFTTTLGGGVDFFDDLPTAINVNVSTSVPLGNQATLSFFVDRAPSKFNAMTLNNQIKAWRYGPNLYWQIAPDTSFFSLVRWGRYNDGNREQQSFSRLEQKLGDFSIAANVFNWRYRNDAELTSGYFSPADFLVANGEIAWQGEVFDWLDCRLLGAWGQQRLAGSWTSALSYGSQCTFQISEIVELDLGYTFSNVVSQTGGSAFNNRAITGQLRAEF